MNEVILLLTSIISSFFVVLMWNLGKERLYSAIIVFLILISAVGGRIVVFFGHNTNTGNIFYSSVFLATYFLIERYGKKEGIRSIWVGTICVTTFSILVWLSVVLHGIGNNLNDDAFMLVFASVPRLTFASLFAYLISQTTNVYLYIYLKNKMKRRYLWLRANISNLVAQLIDSIIFFTIAFSGTTISRNIMDIIITGFVIKIGFMMIASFLIYLNRIEEEDNGYSSISIT